MVLFLFIQKTDFVLTHENEIKAITKAAWNPAWEDIQVPFNEKSRFFSNQLIFN